MSRLFCLKSGVGCNCETTTTSATRATATGTGTMKQTKNQQQSNSHDITIAAVHGFVAIAVCVACSRLSNLTVVTVAQNLEVGVE